MKTTLPILLALLASCAASREAMPPDMRSDYDAATQALEAAQATPDPLDDIEAERALLELEARAMQKNAEPWTDLLPYGLGAVATAAIPLLYRRFRKTKKSADEKKA